MRGYPRIDKDDLSGACSDLREAIGLFLAVSEMEQLSDCFSGLLMIYQKLQLYDRVIAGADSTLSFRLGLANRNGIGSDSITKRVKSLQGDLIITNSSGSGAIVKVMLPLPENKR